jgi:hypothetical protein
MTRKRTKLSLPAPQVTDAELQVLLLVAAQPLWQPSTVQPHRSTRRCVECSVATWRAFAVH